MPGYIKINILIAYIAKTHVQPRARAAAEYDDLTGRVINVPPQHNEVSRQGVSQPWVQVYLKMASSVNNLTMVEKFRHIA